MAHCCGCGATCEIGASSCIQCGARLHDHGEGIHSAQEGIVDQEPPRNAGAALGHGVDGEASCASSPLLASLAKWLSSAERGLSESHKELYNAFADRLSQTPGVSSDSPHVKAPEVAPPALYTSTNSCASEPTVFNAVVPVPPPGAPPFSASRSSGQTPGWLPGSLKEESENDDSEDESSPPAVKAEPRISKLLVSQADTTTLRIALSPWQRSSLGSQRSSLQDGPSPSPSLGHTNSEFTNPSRSESKLSHSQPKVGRMGSVQPSSEVQFELLPMWAKEDKTHSSARMALHQYKAKSGMLDGTEPSSKRASRRGSDRSVRLTGRYGDVNMDAAELDGSESDRTACARMLSQFIIHPCAWKRATWDILSLSLVSWDMAVIPLQFLQPPEHVFVGVGMAWLTRVFWSCDIVASFVTGFLLSDGSIQMASSVVAWHYFRSCFFLDLLLVLCDWAEVIMPDTREDTAADASSYGRIGKAGRTFRVVRMIRLLRLARMRGIVRLFTFRVQSEKITIMFDIAKIMLFVICLAHMMACCWYGICNSDHLDADSWIVTAHARVSESSLENRYVLSLHWSLAQFSGGMDEFRPVNFKERLYAVLILLVAFMLANVCVSALTSSMTRLHILASHQSRQLSILRRYLIQNGIPDKLAMRVQRNALHAISEQQRLMGEQNVELLSVISEPVRVELHFEMYSPVLEVHPFFFEYISQCRVVMQKVCHLAMSTVLVSRGDVIFSNGEIPDVQRMYIVCNGTFDYLPAFGTRTELKCENWLSEPSLWIQYWMHRGTMKGLMDGRLCVLAAQRFYEIVRQFEQPDTFNPRNYAMKFLGELNSMQKKCVEITDLPLGLEEELKDKLFEANLDVGREDSTMHTQKGLAKMTAALASGVVRFAHDVVGNDAGRSMMDSNKRRMSRRRASVLMPGPEAERNRSRISTMIQKSISRDGSIHEGHKRGSFMLQPQSPRASSRNSQS